MQIVLFRVLITCSKKISKSDTNGISYLPSDEVYLLEVTKGYKGPDGFFSYYFYVFFHFSQAATSSDWITTDFGCAHKIKNGTHTCPCVRYIHCKGARKDTVGSGLHGKKTCKNNINKKKKNANWHRFKVTRSVTVHFKRHKSYTIDPQKTLLGAPVSNA